MLGSIETWASHFGHSRIHLDEVVPILTRIDDIDHFSDERGTVGGEEGSRLDLEVELASCFLCEFEKESLHMIPDFLKVCRFLIVHASDLESSSK